MRRRTIAKVALLGVAAVTVAAAAVAYALASALTDDVDHDDRYLPA